MSVLELGCGVRPTPGALHHDKTPHSPFVDVAHDLDKLPWPWTDGEFDKVLALDVMEHLRLDVEQWLDECWRILAPSGLLVLRLPNWSHENSHIDPTHRKLFHHDAFYYWQPGHYYHENYGRFYFPPGRWWQVESAEYQDAGANLAFVLRKLAQ